MIPIAQLRPSQDSIVILYKGGRLPLWADLPQATRDAHSQEHVDLMLQVAQEHGLMRLEGYRLLTPQREWSHFWVIEFPTLAGAEAWIDAEMKPPYGRYGFYEYYISRRWAPDYFSSWVSTPRPPEDTTGIDPHRIPALAADEGSIVGLLFGKMLPEGLDKTDEERGDHEHVALMKDVAREHGLMRLEGFKLIGPQADWHRAWVTEFPTLRGLEAWNQGELTPPHARYAAKSFLLARRWAPAFFASWVQQGGK